MASKALFSIIPRVKRKEEKEERKRSFLKNGSMLLKDLIASCDGKSHPIRCHSAAEFIRATNNFDRSCIIDGLHYGKNMYKGILDDRTVIIKQHYSIDEAIRDIIISMQMSTHKNSLKLLGCCLEFDTPALVFENAGKGGLKYDGSLVVDNELLPWKTRLRIAKQLASALTYLHTAFPRPIVHRSITSHCILLDDDYVPKLLDFSFSITIPPDQFYVQENFAKGTFGYADPTYANYCQSSEKTDVYSFGVLLLVFLMRREAVDGNSGHEELTKDPKLNVSDGQIQIETIADPKILEEVRGDEQAQQQLKDFLALALLCIQDQSEARPDMIDVAKELVRIDKSILP
ncbi:non-functional pseudokinase ZED1-like [Prunus avium]|uniref:Non-functional pseudokinase ZED1-like n=1 Tax=Prunus avium TaxID=42229 RepID=A0A6P5TJY6_PRUAV|nr:non-functional pseudokinase ZED1-like [Prunus avium]